MSSKIIGKLRGALSVTQSRVVDLYTRCKRWVVEAYQAVVAWVGRMLIVCTRMISRLRDAVSINGDMARHGVLLLSFGLILLSVKQVSETPIPILGSILPPPACFSTALRIILIVISLTFVITVVWIWRKYKLKGRLKLVAYLISSLLLLFALWLVPPIPAIPVSVSTSLGIIALAISLIFIVAVFCRWLANKLEDFLKGQFQYMYWLIFWLAYIIGFLRGLSSVSVENIAYPYVSWLGLIWFFVIVIIYFRAIGQTGKRK